MVEGKGDDADAPTASWSVVVTSALCKVFMDVDEGVCMILL